MTDFDTDCARAVAIQADGKIVAAGYSGHGDVMYDFLLARYTTSGKLDGSFGSGGKVLTDVGVDDYAFSVAVQPDGKIVAAGLSTAKGSGDFALVRYTKSGALDASFGSGGKVLTDLGANSYDGASAVAVQADGKIVAAGFSRAKGSGDFALVRYTTSGKLDASFGLGGKVLTNLGGARTGPLRSR